MKLRLLVVMVVLMGGYTLCQAGWLDDTLENAGKRLGNRGVNDAGNSAYDAAKGVVKGKGKSPDGKTGTSQKSTSSAEEKAASSITGRQDTAQEASGSAVTIEEAETVYTKFDFIPGDTTIFFDDFSDTDVGEFPRKWTLEGPKRGNSNTVDVVEVPGQALSALGSGTERAVSGNPVFTPGPEG